MNNRVFEMIFLATIVACYLMLGVVIAAIFGLSTFSIVWFALIVVWFPLLVVVACCFWFSMIFVIGFLHVIIRGR